MLGQATIVLPAFDEEEALPVVVEDIRSVLGPDADIVVVDDGSTDDTAAVGPVATPAEVGVG